MHVSPAMRAAAIALLVGGLACAKNNPDETVGAARDTTGAAVSDTAMNQSQSGVTDSSGQSTLGDSVTRTRPDEGQPVTSKGDTINAGVDSVPGQNQQNQNVNPSQGADTSSMNQGYDTTGMRSDTSTSQGYDNSGVSADTSSMSPSADTSSMSPSTDTSSMSPGADTSSMQHGDMQHGDTSSMNMGADSSSNMSTDSSSAR